MATNIPDIVRSRPLENKDTISFWRGAAISIHPISGCILARATVPVRRCIGLANIGTGVGFSELVQWEGVMQLDDWTRTTGSVYLLLNTAYYLGLVPGQLQASAPNVVGQLVQRIGYSISPTELLLNFGEPDTLAAPLTVPQPLEERVSRLEEQFRELTAWLAANGIDLPGYLTET